MIDIHSHILYGIDDGAEDMEMSIDMARMYLENGINTVIATPHYIEEFNSSPLDKNVKVLEKLKEELEKKKLDLQVLLGNEAYISVDLLKNLEGKKIATLNNTRYILVELPMNDLPIYVENIIYELLIKGYVPIIAHPERNARIIEEPNILYNYINKGALAQLNLPSIEGKYGDKVRDISQILLTHNMIHFIGADAHSNRRRSPKVKNALEELKSLVGTEEFDKLTYHNPKLLIEDRIIETNEPKEYIKKKVSWPLRILSRWTGQRD